MGIKQFNDAALFDFTNVTGPNGSNWESEISHFTGALMLKRCCPFGM